MCLGPDEVECILRKAVEDHGLSSRSLKCVCKEWTRTWVRFYKQTRVFEAMEVVELVGMRQASAIHATPQGRVAMFFDDHIVVFRDDSFAQGSRIGMGNERFAGGTCGDTLLVHYDDVTHVFDPQNLSVDGILPWTQGRDVVSIVANDGVVDMVTTTNGIWSLDIDTLTPVHLPMLHSKVIDTARRLDLLFLLHDDGTVVRVAQGKSETVLTCPLAMGICAYGGHLVVFKRTSIFLYDLRRFVLRQVLGVPFPLTGKGCVHAGALHLPCLYGSCCGIVVMKT